MQLPIFNLSIEDYCKQGSNRNRYMVETNKIGKEIKEFSILLT